jgi:hypothetical protein
VVQHDLNITSSQQYGDQRAITSKLSLVQLGDDQLAVNQLLALELERLEEHLEAARDKLVLVPGAEKQGISFRFTEATFFRDPLGDINVLTYGLARKLTEHQQATIFHIVNMHGKRVLQVQNGVLLVPCGHELATWIDEDVSLQRWDSTKSTQHLLQSGEDMED